MKKPVPSVEPRPKIRVKTTAARPPPVVINEPTEQEVIARLNNPSESDNSSPGAEIPVHAFASTDYHLFLYSLLLYEDSKRNEFLLFSRTLLALPNESLILSRTLSPS